METFRHGETVRLVGPGWTASQRHTLWVADFSGRSDQKDWGSSNVPIHRIEDRDCIIVAPRYLIEPACILDLLVAD